MLDTSIYTFPLVCWALCGIGIILALFTLIWLLAPMRATGRYYKYSDITDESDSDVNKSAARCPKASVIVYYSFTDDEQTMNYLESLNNQDYPDYEIILVMDSSYENGVEMAERCALKYPNVYVTFIPPGSHNLSRRKLALTLGMKASKGEIAVTTVSNSAIPSNKWLSDMMRPFVTDQSKEIVLGYSRLDYAEMSSIWRWKREFDDLLTDSQWIGYALREEPYRGDGYNLAFKRELFFEHKGYSKSIYLHSGDDDLFISEISNSENTAVTLQPTSILTTHWGNSTARTWRERKEQYRFTAHWLRHGPFIRQGMTSAMQWIVSILLSVSAAIGVFSALRTDTMGITDFIPAVVSAVSLVTFWQIEIMIYRRAAKTMGATRLWWAIPIFWLWQPIGNMLFNMKHKRSSVKNFTWQRT